MRFASRFGALLVTFVVVACQNRAAAPSIAKADSGAGPASAGVIDSALPMDVMMARFRRDVPKVDKLHSDVTSRDELVRRIVSAMAKDDTTTLVNSTVNLAEYAWVYFPTAKVAKPPYEIPPALAWFQVQEKNRRGALRALRELGGHRVVLESYRCDEIPTIEDQNRIWTGCVVTISRDGTRVTDLRLFGGILERNGRFEVVSFQNDF